MLNMLIKLGKRICQLEEEMEVMEKLLAERNRVMHAIPACKAHGDQCVPHALEWIAKRKLSCRVKTDQVQLVLNLDLRKESDGETVCM